MSGDIVGKSCFVCAKISTQQQQDMDKLGSSIAQNLCTVDVIVVSTLKFQELVAKVKWAISFRGLYVATPSSSNAHGSAIMEFKASLSTVRSMFLSKRFRTSNRECLKFVNEIHVNFENAGQLSTWSIEYGEARFRAGKAKFPKRSSLCCIVDVGEVASLNPLKHVFTNEDLLGAVTHHDYADCFNGNVGAHAHIKFGDCAL